MNSRGDVLMMRGQAFDTFKLMIAAVVAVAILGILLTIIGNISPQLSNPETMIQQQLGKASDFPGSTFVSEGKAMFRKGVQYSESSFKDIIGGASGQAINFCCATALKTGSPLTCDAGTTTVSINSDFEAKIVAVCSDTICYIGIGDGSAASTGCVVAVAPAAGP